MLFWAILLVANRTWPRTKICWILPNTFYILPDWFCLYISFYSRFEALILICVVFQLGKWIKQAQNIKQETKLCTRQKTLCIHALCIFIWYSLDSKCLSSYFPFVLFLSWQNLLKELSILVMTISSLSILSSTYSNEVFIHSTLPCLLSPNPIFTFSFSFYSTSQQQFNMVNHILLLETLWLSSGTPLFLVFGTTLLVT